MLHKSERGFTLLELLIVVVIIGILSTIVVPGLTSGKDRANVAKGKALDSSLYHYYGVDAAGVWNLDETTGTSAGDLSSNSNTCTASGTSSWSSSAVYSGGLALSSSPTGGYLDCGTSTDYDSSDFTLAMWVKPTAFSSKAGNGGNSNALAYRENYGVSGFRLGFTPSGRVDFWSSESGGTFYVTSGTNVITSSRFYHVAVTYKSSTTTASIFIDGKQVGSASSVTYNVPTGRVLYINYIGGWCCSDVVYDNVRYYTTSMITRDLHQLYAQELPEFSGKI